MDILITDVTEMGSGNYCVAGWDAAANRMVRPLPNGGNWPAALLGQYGIVAGTTINVSPKGAATGVFPHRTEDTAIDPMTISTANGQFADWQGPQAPQVAHNLRQGFSGNLDWNSTWNDVRQGVHTLPRRQCSSLVAISIPSTSLSFCEVFESLKATLNDGDESYQLTVSSKVLKEAWRAGGLPAVRAALPNRATYHVRVGLARPFGAPPKCYAMLNGVL